MFRWYLKIPLVVLNITAFVLGIAAGLILWKLDTMGMHTFARPAAQFIKPFGDILISMLKMIVIPIICCSLICGVSSISLKQFGKMGGLVMLWYLATSLFASIFGCVVALFFSPNLHNAPALVKNTLAQLDGMSTAGGATSQFPLLNIFYNLFTNPFHALAEGRFLSVIVSSILFGLAARVLLDSAKTPDSAEELTLLLKLFNALQRIVFKIIDWILLYFPFGIFALSTSCFAQNGFALINTYFQVALCVIIGILLMLFVCYPLIILLTTRQNPYPILWKLKEPILTAFVTRSSAAALPVSIRTATETLHIKPELSGFVLSLGSTVNMDGVCIHLPAFAVLAANYFNIPISFGMILILIFCVVIASVGAGGVPGGSVFLLFLALSCLHLTPEQTSMVVALALGINPLLDMFETACNVAGDNIGNFIVGHQLKMIEETPQDSFKV